MILNQEQLNKYIDIFGLEKMHFLKKEYLTQADSIWQELDKLNLQEQKSKFHNWRSSSMVFGLEDFATLCKQLENNITKNNLQNLNSQIILCKECFDKSITRLHQKLKD